MENKKEKVWKVTILIKDKPTVTEPYCEKDEIIAQATHLSNRMSGVSYEIISCTEQNKSGKS